MDYLLYFREVFPWNPSCFADRRDTWVKVFGIPLHAWGDKLFKAIGGLYGEFLDYDNNTASRAKLDVACLKISTSFRGNIDDPVHIQALGVNYTLRVVEDKTVEYGFHHGERLEERDCSWVASVNNLGEERVVDGGDRGGRYDGETVGEEEDNQSGHNQLHGEDKLQDGDGSLVDVEKEQNSNLLLLTGGCLEEQNGNCEQQVRVGENSVEKDIQQSGSLSKKLRLGQWDVEREGVPSKVIETCPVSMGVDFRSGPRQECGAFNVKQIRFNLSEPNPWQPQTRSMSLPPNRNIGPSSRSGRNNNVEGDFEDTISLIEVRGGAEIKAANHITVTTEIDSTHTVRRGRSRTQRDKSKITKQPRFGKPKFMQLGEALKEGGGRRRKKNLEERGKGCSEVEEMGVSEEDSQKGSDAIVNLNEEGSLCSVVPESAQGITLEVVLPAIQSTPCSGLVMLQQLEGCDEGPQQRGLVPLGSAKLLQLQQQIGFCYREPDVEVIKNLEIDEQRDRAKKQEWEQSNGFQ
jgi:hypothetical protein